MRNKYAVKIQLRFKTEEKERIPVIQQHFEEKVLPAFGTKLLYSDVIEEDKISPDGKLFLQVQVYTATIGLEGESLQALQALLAIYQNISLIWFDGDFEILEMFVT